MFMDTKLKADISEQFVALRLLERGLNVLKPLGDRLSYDMVAECKGKFFKIQVKRAWKRRGVYIVDSRRTKTNRRRMLRQRYDMGDFDIAVVHIPDSQVIYIMPIGDFLMYKSEITFPMDGTRRQRKPLSWKFREAWDIFFAWKK